MFSKIILIGADRFNERAPLTTFAAESKRIGLQVLVILDNSRHSAGDPTCERLAAEGIEFVLQSSFSSFFVQEFFDESTFALSVNSQWLFSNAEIQFFRGRLYNYHNADLPRRRGRAAHSWRYLENIRKTELTFHEVSLRVDSGLTLYSLRVRDRMDSIESFYKDISHLEVRAFRKFLRQLDRFRLFSLSRSRAKKSYYYPAINSETDGFIDWSWSSEEIVLFCKALGSPHRGAKTYLDGALVSIKGAKLAHSEKNHSFHPYQAGLILYLDANVAIVAARGQGLEIPRSMISEESNLRVGRKFRTPSSVLDKN